MPANEQQPSITNYNFTENEEGIRQLHICPAGCGCDMVQPVTWTVQQTQVDEELGLFGMVLECPNCDWEGEDIFTTPEIDAYDARVDAGLNEMQRLTEQPMRDYLARFTVAIEDDRLLPEDF
jgi:hypothetical protein